MLAEHFSVSLSANEEMHLTGKANASAFYLWCSSSPATSCGRKEVVVNKIEIKI
jgi:hypothetical protein